jgi:hypothetical protein
MSRRSVETDTHRWPEPTDGAFVNS